MHTQKKNQKSNSKYIKRITHTANNKNIKNFWSFNICKCGISDTDILNTWAIYCGKRKADWTNISKTALMAQKKFTEKNEFQVIVLVRFLFKTVNILMPTICMNGSKL